MERVDDSSQRPLRQRWPNPSAPRPIVCIGAGGIVNDAHLPAYRAAQLPVAGVYDREVGRARDTARRFALPRVFEAREAALSVSEAVFDVAVPARCCKSPWGSISRKPHASSRRAASAASPRPSTCSCASVPRFSLLLMRSSAAGWVESSSSKCS
jgi:hypothetical protein